MKLYHDPQAVLDYTVDWSDWLATGETIASSSWTVPAGLTKGAEADDDTKSWVWVSGGTAGTTYTIVCHVTTSAGRQDDRSITLECRQR